MCETSRLAPFLGALAKCFLLSGPQISKVPHESTPAEQLRGPGSGDTASPGICTGGRLGIPRALLGSEGVVKLVTISDREASRIRSCGELVRGPQLLSRKTPSFPSLRATIQRLTCVFAPLLGRLLKCDGAWPSRWTCGAGLGGIDSTGTCPLRVRWLEVPAEHTPECGIEGGRTEQANSWQHPDEPFESPSPMMSRDVSRLGTASFWLPTFLGTTFRRLLLCQDRSPVWDDRTTPLLSAPYA